MPRATSSACSGPASTRSDRLGRRRGEGRSARAEGALRPDVGTGDVLMLVALVVTGMGATAGALGPQVYERVLALALDGLRPGSAAPLPGRPLTPEDLDPRV
ncbi:hypothetical protein [Nocardiopsis tropica]|uniref:SbtR family transcriptional regulator n=1 Tax=Nocardiopsis tropica TaxID=109330 RepID=UPI0038B37C63